MENQTVKTLRTYLKKFNIKGLYKLRKAELYELYKEKEYAKKIKANEKKLKQLQLQIGKEAKKRTELEKTHKTIHKEYLKEKSQTFRILLDQNTLNKYRMTNFDIFFIRRIMIDHKLSGNWRFILGMNYLVSGNKFIPKKKEEKKEAVPYDITYKNIPISNKSKNRYFDQQKAYSWWGTESALSIFDQYAADEHTRDILKGVNEDDEEYIFMDENGKFENPFDKNSSNNQLPDDFIYGFNPNFRLTLLVTKAIEMTPNNAIQYFLDQQNGHCFFSPIIEDCNKHPNDKNYRRIKNKAIKNMEKYKDGIPPYKFQKVSDEMLIGIDIYDCFNKLMHSVRPEKKYHKIYRYVNTRLNHVDMLISDQKDVEVLNEVGLSVLYEKLKASNQVFSYVGNKNNKIFEISTFDKKYIIEDTDYSKTVKEWEEKYNMKAIKYNYMQNPELTKFIEDSLHVSGCVDFKNDFHNISKKLKFRNIDQIKSYTQFKANDYYKGFPSLITDFSKVPDDINVPDFLDKHIGFFYVTNISFDQMDQSKRAYFEKLNIYINSYYDEIEQDNIYTNAGAYPSVELKYMYDLGMRFKINYGAWSVKSFDFEFDESMKQKEYKHNTKGEEIGLSYYSKWCGINQKSDEYKEYRLLNCNKDLAQVIKNQYPDSEVSFYDKLDELVLSDKRTYGYNYMHISAFVTAYQRINIYNQLLKLDINKVLRVVVDGIYCEDHEFELMPTFLNKPARIPQSTAGKSYVRTYSRNQPILRDYLPNYQYNLYNGPGGSGKTTTAIKEYMSNCLFTTISNRLVVEKKQEYNIKGMNLDRLLEHQCFSNIKYHPAVIIVDECTMIPNSYKDDLITKFPYSKIIFCGDFMKSGNPYQLPIWEGEKFNFDKIQYTRKFKNIYRTTDPLLLNLLMKVRQMMKENVPERKLCTYVFNYLGQNKCLIDQETLIQNYKLDDFVLCSTHEKIKYYTNLLKGKYDKEKYLCKIRHKGLDNENKIRYIENGEILYSKNKPKNTENRHAFTIHQVQGLTVTSNLYIEPTNMFCYEMMYVALSRAKTLSQIKLIVNRKK